MQDINLNTARSRRSLMASLRGWVRDEKQLRSHRQLLVVESLEARELLSTIQNFDTAGTAFSLAQAALPPPATIKPNGPTGNFLRVTSAGSVSNNNSIAFVQSDGGTFTQAVADFDFRISGGRGDGLGFALLNTSNFGTSGPQTSVVPESALFDGSLGIGFSTFSTQSNATDNSVTVSFNSAIVQNFPISTSTLDLASGLFIHAHITVDFQTTQVSVVLTPSGGSPLTVVDALKVPGLGPYSSRVQLGARSGGISNSFADIDLDNIQVNYIGARLPGAISFSSSSYAVMENQPAAQVTVIRTGGSAGSFTVSFAAADGTARGGVNYVPVSGVLTFGEGETTKTIVVPIIDDKVDDTNKVVNLYLSNPTFQAPLSPPITATLTIINTDVNLTPPTVSPKVKLAFAPRTRRALGFTLSFSELMDPTRAQDLNNYVVQEVPRRGRGPGLVVPLSSAVYDPTTKTVTLFRADLGRRHLSSTVRITVNGTSPGGLTNQSGVFLSGRGKNNPGTNAILFAHP